MYDTKVIVPKIVYHFATTADRLAYPFSPSDLGAEVWDDQEGNRYTVMGSGIGAAMSSQFGSLRQIPKQVTYAASMSIDVSQGNIWQITPIVTADFALTLTGGQDGDKGEIYFKQAAAGGKKITAITVSGRTGKMTSDLTTLNTTGMLVANAHCKLTYNFFTAVDAIVEFGMVADTAVAFT